MTLRRPSDVEHGDRLTEFIQRIPKHLYRFTELTHERVDWIRRLLVQHELYFPSPSTFNDPLDCRLVPEFAGSRLTMDAYWRSIGRENFPHLSKKELKQRAARMARTSATPEGREELANVIRRSVESNGTACFATDPTSVLLWSYYARGHSGVAIRFRYDIDNVHAFLKSAYAQGAKPFIVEVQYKADLPRVNWYSSPTLDRLQLVLGTKAEAWRHEGEWRIALPNRVGYLKIPPPLIDGVLFGMKTDPGTETLVRQWAHERGGGIEFLRIVNKPGSFELTTEPA